MFEFGNYLKSGHYKSYFLAFCATTFLNIASATEAIIGVAPTVLVESSTELIPDELSISNLPKTISLGWETEAEIRELKRQLVEFNLVSPKSCMSWVYVRSNNKTKLFMLNMVKSHGVLRLNESAFASRAFQSYFSKYIAPLDLREKFGKFDAVSMFGTRVHLNLGFEAKVKSSKNTTCTFTNVKCRRYEFSDFPITFSIPVNRIDGERVPHTQLKIKNTITKPVSYFAEDMCPNTSDGLIEAKHNYRMGETGELVNALAGGIAFNRDIKKALMEDLKK